MEKLSVDAREVLFHLNYLGYRNISKEQLKEFMIDLKRLLKYESNLKPSTEAEQQSKPTLVTDQRLFKTQTIASHTKQKEKPNKISKKDQSQLFQHQIRPLNPVKVAHKETNENEVPQKSESQLIKHKSVNDVQTLTSEAKFHSKQQSNDKRENPDEIDKENNSADKVEVEQVKPKMWIRPRSVSQTRQKTARKSDPVLLYQAYQKDWEKFKSNICESSHSDLRWSIREKMMGRR
ncbi:CLUMA_CG003284, isoform A [Clunio marinus]|uniref:CLUMA_CG003284, isoform A n=1 Tax=Clunio marinus TaxID=568069 RepID=A0A1J1HNK6_9DIPT|nr:CLUMA_CG003284, isoform A [Clunio marinus]